MANNTLSSTDTEQLVGQAVALKMQESALARWVNGLKLDSRSPDPQELATYQELHEAATQRFDAAWGKLPPATQQAYQPIITRASEIRENSAAEATEAMQRELINGSLGRDHRAISKAFAEARAEQLKPVKPAMANTVESSAGRENHTTTETGRDTAAPGFWAGSVTAGARKISGMGKNASGFSAAASGMTALALFTAGISAFRKDEEGKRKTTKGVVFTSLGMVALASSAILGQHAAKGADSWVSRMTNRSAASSPNGPGI